MTVHILCEHNIPVRNCEICRLSAMLEEYRKAIISHYYTNTQEFKDWQDLIYELQAIDPDFEALFEIEND